MRAASLVVILLVAASGSAADVPKPDEHDATLTDFRFAAGGAPADVRLHYRTLGKPVRGPDGKVANAVLVLHGTGGSGGNFVEGKGGELFAGELFGPGQLLDVAKYYVVLPDNLGHGKSSKPSDGLKAHFPRYGYADMISAQHRLLTEVLKVDHLRLVIGTSMGGMHTWLWGETYPGFADALMPLASLPTQISGRNRMWRKTVTDAIRNDPAWKNGDYTSQPPSLRTAAQMLVLMSANPLMRQAEGPTRKAAGDWFDAEVDRRMKTLDANDVLYAVDCSWDYDPGPRLKSITAPLVAVNFADDLINPPELGILERDIKAVPKGKAVLIPASAETIGHGTHTKAAVWKSYLKKLLEEPAR
jgi:homoserine O-acetyltransferase/O-succinyltransferase